MRKMFTSSLLLCTLLVTNATASEDEQKSSDRSSKATPASARNKNASEGKKWKSMFDGKTLKGWEPAKGIDYEQAGKVAVKKSWLVLAAGEPGTGVRWRSWASREARRWRRGLRTLGREELTWVSDA